VMRWPRPAVWPNPSSIHSSVSSVRRTCAWSLAQLVGWGHLKIYLYHLRERERERVSFFSVQDSFLRLNLGLIELGNRHTQTYI
jgi:hypothetical protein